MAEYFCSKDQRTLEVSRENYDFCRNCEESSSTILRARDKDNPKKRITGESLVCHCGESFEIPSPSHSFFNYALGALARTFAEINESTPSGDKRQTRIEFKRREDGRVKVSINPKPF